MSWDENVVLFCVVSRLRPTEPASLQLHIRGKEVRAVLYFITLYPYMTIERVLDDTG